MNSDGLLRLDEDVRELLLEVARDPRSTLFGVTPAEVATSPRLDVPSVSAGTAGWTPAERHLLTGYREAVAEVLIPVLVDMVLGEGPSPFIGRPGVRPPKETGLRARHLLSAERAKTLDPTVTSVLRAIARGQARPDQFALAKVIRKLRPDHRGALLEGFALLEHRPLAARTLLREVYEESNRPSIRYKAAVNLGLATDRTGNLAASLEPYCAAVRERPGLSPLASLVINATLTGQDELANLAGSYLEDIASPIDETFRELLGYHENKMWSDADRACLRGVEKHVGPQTRNILDAILQK